MRKLLRIFVYAFICLIISASSFSGQLQRMHLALLSQGGGEGPAKSVIFDIADNHGSGNFISVRSIDFYFEYEKIEMLTADFTAYSTTVTAGGTWDPDNAFDTSLSKTGVDDNNQWLSISLAGTPVDQRLTIVFDTPQNFDMIIINNSHDVIATTDRGAKTVKITSSTDAITSTVYNQAIAHRTVLADGDWVIHDAVDLVQEEIVYNIGGTDRTRSVVFDIDTNHGDASFMSLRSAEFKLDSVLIALTNEFDAYSTTETFPAIQAFNTSLSKTGDDNATSWLGLSATNLRLTVNFDEFQEWDSITVNNAHESGGKTNRGCNATKIYMSMQWTPKGIGTTFEAALPAGSVYIFNGNITEHPATDTVSDEVLSLTLGGL